MSFDETIAAQSSAHGCAPRGLIRISGHDALNSLRKCVDPFPAYSDRSFVHACTVLPWPLHRVTARLFFWPEGKSYTGRQTVEIHTIGAQPILDALLIAVCDHPSVRVARPGEFTLQAFLAGRVDLTQAEAVLGIIDAPDERALGIALDQMAGGVMTDLNAIRVQLFDALVHIEAGLDFADENIEFISEHEIRSTLANALAQTEKLLQRAMKRRWTNKIPLVVLAGPPNVGKSSLFNALAGRRAALVSALPGTTRDYVETEINAEGFSFKLVDTAGIGGGFMLDSEIDQKARRAATEILERADLVIRCRETQDHIPCNTDSTSLHTTNEQTGCLSAEMNTVPRATEPRVSCGNRRLKSYAVRGMSLCVLTKIDSEQSHSRSDKKCLGRPSSERHGFREREADGLSGKSQYDPREDFVAVSAKTGQGIPELRRKIVRSLQALDHSGDFLADTAARCCRSMQNAVAALQAALAMTTDATAEHVLLAAEINDALHSLNEIDGKVCHEEMLDKIFERFCIGK